MQSFWQHVEIVRHFGDSKLLVCNSEFGTCFVL